jgi:hypothetical protein
MDTDHSPFIDVGKEHGRPLFSCPFSDGSLLVPDQTFCGQIRCDSRKRERPIGQVNWQDSGRHYGRGNIGHQGLLGMIGAIRSSQEFIWIDLPKNRIQLNCDGGVEKATRAVVMPVSHRLPIP